MVKDRKHYITIFVAAEFSGDDEPQNLEPNKCEGWFWKSPAGNFLRTYFEPQTLWRLRTYGAPIIGGIT